MDPAPTRDDFGPSPDFLASLADTDLYSVGAFFCDHNPELIDDLVARSAEIESRGLRLWAHSEGIDPEEAFGILLTGLAVRYYKAVAA